MSRANLTARAWMSAVAVLLGASTDAHAEITNMDFCDKFAHDVYIAVAYQQKDEGWISRGWLHVKTGECQFFDSAVHVASFYYRAETDSYDVGNGNTASTSWGDKGDKKFYVADASFDYFDALNSDDSKSRLAGFSRYFGDSSLTSVGDVSATVTFEVDGSVSYSVKPIDH